MLTCFLYTFQKLLVPETDERVRSLMNVDEAKIR